MVQSTFAHVLTAGPEPCYWPTFCGTAHCESVDGCRPQLARNALQLADRCSLLLERGQRCKARQQRLAKVLEVAQGLQELHGSQRAQTECLQLAESGKEST